VSAAALNLFVLAAFALPTDAAYSLAFYVGVPLLAVSGRLRLPRVTRGDYAAAALILWSGLTLLWGEGDTRRVYAFALGTASTGAFLVILRSVLEEPEARRHLLGWLVWCGAANAALALSLGAPALLRGERMLGWGITKQPILGGSVMAVAALTALHIALSWPAQPGVSGRDRLFRAAHFAAAGLMAVFILAMQSRGVLLAATIATLCLLSAGPWRRPAALFILAAGFGLAVAVPAGWRHHAIALMVARGTSHRPEIWARAWTMIRQEPVFGHGLAAILPPDRTGFPHSLYLSLLFYSGAIGLCLFAALACCVTGTLLVRRREAETPWIAALWLNALVAGLTDFGQVVKGPGPLWLILWLPTALAVSTAVTRRAATSGPRSPASQ
jgi:O-antigen ligase